MLTLFIKHPASLLDGTHTSPLQKGGGGPRMKTSKAKGRRRRLC